MGDLLKEHFRYSTVEILENSILVVKINRPDVFNALHPDAMFELSKIFDFYEQQESLRVCIITGEGNKAFCAGFDLKWNVKYGSSQDALESFPAKGFGGITARKNFFKPLIAAVNGFAMGGGFEIVLCCDIVIASESAIFGLPEPKVGLAALAGGLARLPRSIPYQRAMGMILTGKSITANEGLNYGFINEVVKQNLVLERAIEWAKEVQKCSPDSIKASKQVVNFFSPSPDVTDAYELQKNLMHVFQMSVGENKDEGNKAFVQKRPPQWKIKFKL